MPLTGRRPPSPFQPLLPKPRFRLVSCFFQGRENPESWMRKSFLDKEQRWNYMQTLTVEPERRSLARSQTSSDTRTTTPSKEIKKKVHEPLASCKIIRSALSWFPFYWRFSAATVPKVVDQIYRQREIYHPLEFHAAPNVGVSMPLKAPHLTT